MLTQLINTGAEVVAPVDGDFLTSNITIEVGGKSKTARQVSKNELYLVAADNLETGIGTKIPLWLFGLLY